VNRDDKGMNLICNPPASALSVSRLLEPRCIACTPEKEGKPE
jgi:hypothetical protein